MAARRWTALAGLTVAALVLGYLGFERLPEGDGWSFGDSLHRSIQLFVLESGGVAPPVPWELEVARLLAPALTVAAAVLAAATLFRDQLRQLAVRMRARDHVVVAGVGSKGFQLARRLREQGEAVVVIERDPVAPGSEGCRVRGIPVIAGDATDPRILERAALSRARQLFVLCGDDGTNSEVAFAAREAASGADRGLAAFVHLDDLDLWRHLQGHELSAAPGSLRIEFFNLADAAARLLLERHPPFEPGAADPHVIVCGTEGIGESVALHAARASLAEHRAAGRAANGGARRLRLTVCGPDAAADRTRLLARHPALNGLCDVHALELHAGEPSRPPADLPPPTAAYVCVPSEARGVALALALRASGTVGSLPVVVAVRDEDEGMATALRPGAGVVPFGVLTRVMTSDLVTLGTTEVLARAKHAQYVRDERDRGGTPESNPSMVPWHELSESLRQSNRRFAEGVGRKLTAAGIAVVPAPLADPGAAAGILPEEQVEELAVAEHDRWCEDLVADGWRHGPGPKDPERKLHPSLVPWSELSEEERDKDREPVRALPEMLAHVGFELRPASGPRQGAERPQSQPQPASAATPPSRT